MANYGHGGNAKEISREKNINYKHIIDFSANINPLGICENVKKSIFDNIKLIEKYPDMSYFELKTSIADYEGISSEHIILGNGAAEVLFNIIRAIQPKKTLLLAPTFSEYEEAVAGIKGDVKYYYLKEEDSFKLNKDYLNFINKEIDLLIICNPNNPTGTLVSRQDIIKITEKAAESNVKVLVDESFLDFLSDEYSVKKYISKYKNLIIIKSLTKFFALPGLRIGYGMCADEEVLRNTNILTPAWNINILAEKAAISAIKDEKYINDTKLYIHKEKKYLYDEMEKIKNIKVFKPTVNFLFFKVNKNIDLFSKLLKENILIRSCSNYNGLNEKYYRIGIKTHKDNENFIEKLKNILI